MNEDDEKVGADYIAEKMQALYPDQEGFYYGTVLPYFLGGKDPLDGVEVYISEKEEGHWHYVTYGFSNLYDDVDDEDEDDEEEEDNEETKDSGYGFELTFRLKKETQEPPVWPVNLLQNLARYVFSTGNCFDAGHHMSCNGPIALDTDTKLMALGFCIDPELGEMDTCSGHVKFLQAVALTLDEMYAMMHWIGEKFLKELFCYIPYGITDLNRSSLLENEKFKQVLDKGIEEDGSSSVAVYTSAIKCYQSSDDEQMIIVEMGAMNVETFLTMLRGRTQKERSLFIIAETFTLSIEWASQSEYCEKEKDFAILRLSKETLQEIQTILRPHVGTYRCDTMPLQFIIERSEIKDSKGKVIEVIE